MANFIATAGTDTLTGAGADDTFFFANGTVQITDTFTGGAGIDTLRLQATSPTGFDFGLNVGAAISGFDVLFFDGASTPLNTSVAATFSHDVLGAGLSSTLSVVGSANPFGTINVTMNTGATITLAGWTFTTWDVFRNLVNVITSSGNDNVTSTITDDRIFDNGGDDVYDGGAGTDTLYYNGSAGVTVRLALATPQNTGGSGIDTISNIEFLGGTTGDDTLGGSSGANTLLGYAGTDTVTYIDATSGVTVRLFLNGANQNTIGAGFDILYDFESITGSDHNDMLGGTTGDNVINGGAGFDYATYIDAPSAVVVSLALNGLAQGTNSAGTDTLISIEGLVGSAFNDTLTGSTGVDVLLGGDGDDVLDDRNGGNGSLFGGNGTADYGLIDYSDRLAGMNFVWSANAAIFIGGVQTGSMIDIERIFIEATNSADDITGGALGDIFYVFAGNDRARGGGGADQMFGGAGVDILQGQADNDVLIGEADADYLYGGDGADQLHGGDGNDNLFGDAGDDRLQGVAGSDQLLGDAGADELLGQDGDDYIYGEADNDLLAGGIGNDRMYGGTGNDTLNGQNDVDVLVAGDGDDIVNGGAGADYIYGGLGVDTANGDDSDDVVQGEDGNDVLNGGAGDDNIYGGVGADSIAGDDGGDYIFGGADGDTIHGNVGVDVLIGEAGADQLFGDLDSDYLYGGGEFDVLSGGDGADRLFGGDAGDAMFGDAGDDVLQGEVGDDGMLGGDGSDYIYGDIGSDELRGEGGNDFLYGGDGIDVVDGGLGDDVMRGNAGADRFVMDTGWGNDYVVDWEDGVDVVDLRDYAGATFANTSVSYGGGGATITLTGGETLFLLGAANGSISAADFLFAP